MRTIRGLVFLGFFWVWTGVVAAQAPKLEPYADIVLNDHPVAYWRFEDSKFETHPKSEGHDKIESGVPFRLYDEDDLNDASAESKGFVRAGQPGPRAEKFLNLEPDNRAVQFLAPTVIKFKDPGEKSLLDFDLGDAITLEAWASVKRLGDGQQIYIVGKGRTKNPGVADDNQNYALRLAGQNKAAGISFLFRSADNRKGKSEDFHRWTSKDSFATDGDWHHLAVSYTFGKSDSLRGYIDGKPVDGVWDYGGATSEGPVVDNDELWIGSASALNPGNSFHGAIDEVAIYRTALPAERIAARYQVVQPKPYLTTLEPPRDGVLVEVFEGIPDKHSWDFITPEPSERYEELGFALIEVAHKYTPRGVRADRSNPFFVRVTGDVELPAGENRFLIRSRSASRLFVDGELLVQNPFPVFRGDGHSDVWDVDRVPAPGHRALRPGDQDGVVSFKSDQKKHRLTWEVFLGGKATRPELGETCVALARPGGETFDVLLPTKPFPLTDEAWTEFESRRRVELEKVNQQRRAEASREFAAFWQRRHELARAKVGFMNWPSVPNAVEGLSANNEIDRFINEKLVVPPSGGPANESRLKAEPRMAEPRAVDDWAFLRRVSLDTIGTIPSAELIRDFFQLPEATRRATIIDRLLEEPGWADHWVGYWQDVLAENPNILNPTLNNTGPFRWWIYESFQDNKPFDQFATELILMDGSERYGGSAGFATATQNDAPFAAKAHVIGQAFLGLEMKCARCHDAPYHDFTQRQLFSVAALLKREPQTLPKTSTVPAGSLPTDRESPVKVTLKPGEVIPPAWPFTHLVSDVTPELLQAPGDSRERLAALITSPNNRRFGQVIVNRMWQRYLGRGFVEPVDDWENANPSHPELLEWLERELITHDYDLKHIARLIFNSRAYQSVARSRRERGSGDPHQRSRDENDPALSESGLHSRRMTAEQLVDSLVLAAGKPFHCEEMNIDVDGGRKQEVSINLGPPRRAWQLTSMSNERDRPSLSLPAAQTIVNVLEAFGWRASRPDPQTIRSSELTALQPALMANGVVAKRVSQFSDDSAFVELALNAKSVESFIDSVVQRVLTRPATAAELALFGDLLRDGFDSRVVPGSAPLRRSRPVRNTGVSWSNHLKPEASERKLRLAEEVERGDPATSRLNADWRERAEDLVWTLVNSPEFVFVP